MSIKVIVWQVTFLLGTTAWTAADDFFPSLQVGSEVYSNVNVTTVTVTDIYFRHTRGMGNAKLKNLAPDVQKRFNYDPAKSSAAEKLQAEATATYLQQAATNRPKLALANDDQEQVDAPVEDKNGELVASKLFAASFRGQRPPPIVVAEWLTPAPDLAGKFLLVDFWATWGQPCREAVPHLNALQAKFKDRLVVIGLSNETVEDMNKMTTPKVHYYIGTDPESRSLTAMQVSGIPHALLLDPQGIVRYEGQAIFLDAKHVEDLMARYSK
jgi:cytochrome c biogenesis protein CcmG/thiol:disulfide interchange protein DsbE